MRITTGDSPDKAAADPARDGSSGALGFERIVSALQRPPSVAHHLAFACMATLIAAACFYIGVVPTRQYASDLTSFADCGWRILQGLRPHVDFSTGLGPFSFMMWAAALKHGGGTVTGFGSPDWARTHERAAASAPAVTLLTAAGARGVAKTVMDEMAFSLLGENAHYGTPKVRAGGGALGVPPLNLPDTSSKEGTAKQGQGPRFCPHLSYVVSREGARAVWGGGQREGGQAQPSRPLSGVSSMHFSSFALFDGLPSG